jgi:prepilin peptidase CpaA
LYLIDLLLLVVLFICLITDLKSRKIYNKVIFPGLLVALLLNLFQFGWDGLFTSLLGFIVGLSILLIPYFMGGMGAGDVKLLALIGALKGVSFVLATAVYMAIIGGVIGVAILVFRKGFLFRLRSVLFLVISLINGLKPSIGLDKSALNKTYPYGVAITGGAFIALLMNGVLPL